MAKDFDFSDFEESPARKLASKDLDFSDFADPAPEYSELDSAGRGITQGALLGFADEAVGGIGAAIKKIQGDERPYSAIYKELRDIDRESNESAKLANPKSFMTGEIGGGLATAIVPIGSGASLTKAVATGAGLGGVAGLGTSNEQGYIDNLKDAGMGVGYGALGGVAGYGVGKGIQKAGEKLQPYLNDFAESQAARALGAERGTIKKLGKDEVRRIGRYALDNEIITPLASTEEKIARNEATKAIGANKMNQVYSEIDDAGASTFNPLNAASKVDEEIGGFYRSPINKGETNQLENTLESILMRGDKDISLSEAQVLKQELGKVANWKNNLNITDKEKMARDAYRVVNEMIDQSASDGATLLNKQGLMETLQGGKALYSKGKGAETLLDNRLAREQGNKMFGLTDTIAGGAGFAALGPSGLLGVGVKKAAEKYGSNTMAVGADKLSKFLLKSPKFQAFAARDPEGFKLLSLQLGGRAGNNTQMPHAAENESEQYDPSNTAMNHDEAIDRFVKGN